MDALERRWIGPWGPEQLSTLELCEALIDGRLSATEAVRPAGDDEAPPQPVDGLFPAGPHGRRIAAIPAPEGVWAELLFDDAPHMPACLPRWRVLETLDDDADPGIAARWRLEWALACESNPGPYAERILAQDLSPRVAEAPRWRLREQVHGVTLAEVLAARRPPLKELIGWLHALCLALQAQRQVDAARPRRPLSPETILITEDRAVIATRARAAAGTDAFAAPESALQGQFGPHADVWSLGILIHLLLKGEAPASLEALREAWRGDPPVLEPPYLYDEPDAALIETAHACLVREPFARPSPRRLARRFAALRFTGLGRPGAPQDLTRTRRRAIITSALGALALAAFTLGFVVEPARRERDWRALSAALSAPQAPARLAALERAAALRSGLPPQRRARVDEALLDALSAGDPAIQAALPQLFVERAPELLAEVVESYEDGARRRGAVLVLKGFGAAAFGELARVFEARKEPVESGLRRFTLSLIASLPAEDLRPEDRAARSELLLGVMETPDAALQASILAALTATARIDDGLRARLEGQLQAPQTCVLVTRILLGVGPQSIPAFERAATSRSLVVRRAVGKALIDFARADEQLRPSILPILVRGLADAEPSVRAMNEEALRGFGMAAIPYLARALGDESQRKAARDLLATLGNLEVARALLPFAEEGQPSAELARQLLRLYAMSQPQVRDELVSRFAEAESRAITAVLATLGPAVLEPLMKVVEGEGPVESRRRALAIIAEMQQRALPVRERLLAVAREAPPRLAAELFAALKAVGIPADLRIPLLLSAFDSAERERREAAAAQIRSIDDSREFALVVQGLRARSQGGDGASEAAALLVEVLGDRAIETFALELDHPDASRRAEARATLEELMAREGQVAELVALLPRARGPKLGEFLIEVVGAPACQPLGELLESPDMGTARRAQLLLLELSQRGHLDEVLEVLCARLPSDDFRTRQWAVDGLVQIGAPALPSLVAELKGEASGRAASRALAQLARSLGFEAVSAPLAGALQGEGSRSWALGTYMMTRPESIPFLCRELTGADAALREDIRKALSTLGSSAFEPCLQALDAGAASSEEVARVLESLATRDATLRPRIAAQLSDEGRRRCCALALQHLGAKALPELLQACGSPEPQVREAALSLLFQLDTWTARTMALDAAAIRDESPAIRELGLRYAEAVAQHIAASERPGYLALVTEALEDPEPEVCAAAKRAAIALAKAFPSYADELRSLSEDPLRKAALQQVLDALAAPHPGG